MSFEARIKPYDPRRGQVGRSYSDLALGRRFLEGQVYRGLSADEAEALRKIPQPRAGRGLLFDVGTPEEMAEILAVEAAAKLGVPRPAAQRVVPAAPSAPAAPEVAVPIDQLEHTDGNGTRVQHTQGAPDEAPPAAPAGRPQGGSGPRRPGGTPRSGTKPEAEGGGK